MASKRLSLRAFEENPAPKSYRELLAEYRMRKQGEQGEANARLVTFTGIQEGKDAYNPSGPFTIDGTKHQWARIESRDAQDAVAHLFRQVSEVEYELMGDVEAIPLEDPFMKVVQGEMLVGGVEISKDEHGNVIGYHTVFYRGETAATLKKFSVGPDGMKDIRVVERPGSDVFVFTRPHIPLNGRLIGRIAMTSISSLDELDGEHLRPEATELLPGLFTDSEWGGVNDVYAFPHGLIGALAHSAMYDEAGKRHYAAAAFVLNPATKEFSPLEIIAERADFPEGPVKVMPENLHRPDMHDDLADVIFSARLTCADEEILSCPTVELTCGLSDAAIGHLTIPNPFQRLIKIYFPELVT